MKAVLRSIKPYWFYLICEGLKTIEVGKTAPKADDWNKSVELYCSKDMSSFNRIPKEHQDKYRTFLGKVGARFVCDKVHDITPIQPFPFGGALDYAFEFEFEKTALTVKEFKDYLDGNSGYGWHISELKIYDKPKELGEFSVYGKCADECSEYDFCLGDSVESRIECPYFKRTPISRPPQSWCYVEVK